MPRGEWIEVIRANVFDAGIYPSFMEEGVREDVKRHINWGNQESPLSHCAFPTAFYSSVSGSGVWLRLNASAVWTVGMRSNMFDVQVYSAAGVTDRTGINAHDIFASLLCVIALRHCFASLARNEHKIGT